MIAVAFIDSFGCCRDRAFHFRESGQDLMDASSQCFDVKIDSPLWILMASVMAETSVVCVHSICSGFVGGFMSFFGMPNWFILDSDV